MVNVEVDASVFAESGAALGRFHGKLDFAIVPRTGEVVSFLFSPNGLGAASSGAPSLQVNVESVIHVHGGTGVTLMLEDVTVESEESAGALAQYLADGFGLFYDSWNENAI